MRIFGRMLIFAAKILLYAGLLGWIVVWLECFGMLSELKIPALGIYVNMEIFPTIFLCIVSIFIGVVVMYAGSLFLAIDESRRPYV